MLKYSIVGGLSTVMHRYHMEYETYIQRCKYNEKLDEYLLGPKGIELIKKVFFYDANALYLSCFGDLMHCDKLKLIKDPNMNIDEIIKKVFNDQLFGWIQCDIEVPKEYMKDKNGNSI